MNGRSFPAAAVAHAAGAAVARHERRRSGGWGTNAAHWTAVLTDGRRVFVKHALDDAAAGWLRAEQRVYAAAVPVAPELLGWLDDEETLLVLQDLSDAHWPPPWRAGDVDAVLAALDDLHALAPPPGLRRLRDRAETFARWQEVSDDREPLLAIGLCSMDWLDEALPLLVEASAPDRLDGGSLLHLDVRSDNLCLDDGRVILVDWNLAAVGNPLLDVSFLVAEPAARRRPGAVGGRARGERTRACGRRLLRVTRRSSRNADGARRARVPAPAGGGRARVGCARTRLAGARLSSRR